MRTWFLVMWLIGVATGVQYIKMLGYEPPRDDEQMMRALNELQSAIDEHNEECGQ